MKRILLDTDIGSDCDDADALLFLLKLGLSLEGVTTVYGNTNVRAKITRKILDYAGKQNVSVQAGESIPLKARHPVWHTGREGEGILAQQDHSTPLCQMNIGYNAPDFLIDRIRTYPNECYIIAIGALTNIAKAFQKAPDIIDKIPHMYIMGGAIAFPAPFDLENLVETNEVEHNIACDVRAAQIVFSTPTPKTVLPLDVTSKVPIQRNDLYCLHTGHPADEAVRTLNEVWFDYRDKMFREQVSYTCMHDPLTVAAVSHPSLLKKVELPLIIDSEGHMRIQKDGMAVNLCYNVDTPAFERLFLDTIALPLPMEPTHELLSNR